MNTKAKISWLISGLSLVILVTVRGILGGWIDYLWVPLAFFVVFTTLAIVFDFKLYLEFFTLRTTKHGANMGVMILLFLAILVGVNFVSVQRNKTWDFTAEKLHSLSDQTVKVLGNLKDPLEVLVFYRGGKDKEEKEMEKATLQRYQDVSAKIKVRFLNSHVEQILAEKYLQTIPNNDRLVVLIEHKGRIVEVQEAPQTNPSQRVSRREQEYTSAIIKATRTDSKKIYFVTGHGELNLNSQELRGMSSLKRALEESAYAVAPLNLIEMTSVPKDAAVLAILGPQSLFTEGEIQSILDFAKTGGRIFIGLDPGHKTGLERLISALGVSYKNNYVVSDRPLIPERGQGAAISSGYDRLSDITKNLEGATIFDLASEVTKAADSTVQIVELVKSYPRSLALTELKNTAIKQSDLKSFTLAVLAEGKVKTMEAGKPEATSDFSAVVFGDSDFVSEKDFFNGLNRDLALNAFGYLAKETDLVSIRPKQPKGTKLNLTNVQQGAIIFAGIALPIVFMVIGGFIWFRRRSA